MEPLTELPGMISLAATNLLARAVEYLPSLVGAVVLLLVGLVVARVLRAIAVKLALGLDRLVQGVGAAAGVERPKLSSSSARIFGTVVFWAVALCFVAAATQLLGLQVFTAWISDVVSYLPTIAVGALIVGAGLVLSRLVRDGVLATATVGSVPQRAHLARMVQSAILVVAILVGAEQIGIKVTFLVILAAALAGIVASTVAVATSLGARSYVADLIGARRVREAFSVGQTIRVGTHEGRILDITAVSVVLEVADGRTTLPASHLSDQPVTVVMEGLPRDAG